MAGSILGTRVLRPTRATVSPRRSWSIQVCAIRSTCSSKPMNEATLNDPAPPTVHKPGARRRAAKR